MKNIIYHFALFIAFMTCATAGHAEQQFITDKIFIDAYEQPHEQGSVTLKALTGTSIEVITIAEDYVQIKNKENKIGWVHNKYITNEKPSQLAFLQIQKKYELVSSELQKLKSKPSQDRDFDKTAKAFIQVKNEYGQLEKEQNTLLNNLAEKSDALEKANNTIVLLTQEMKQNSDTSLDEHSNNIPLEFSVSLAWTIAALILALVSGFALGVKWLGAKINKKYSGLRLY